MQKLSVKPLAKVPLFEAAATLAAICREIEEGVDVDEALVAAFDDAKGLVAEGIDRRKAVVRELDAKLELAKSYKAEAEEYVRKFERIKKRLKDRTLELIEQNPDIPYADSLGKKLTKGESKALKLGFDTYKRAFSNIIDADMADLLDIPEKYLKQVYFLTLDTDAIKADLLAGGQVDWASLQKNTHLKGL
jgi:hypothetical protein